MVAERFCNRECGELIRAGELEVYSAVGVGEAIENRGDDQRARLQPIRLCQRDSSPDLTVTRDRLVCRGHAGDSVVAPAFGEVERSATVASMTLAIAGGAKRPSHRVVDARSERWLGVFVDLLENGRPDLEQQW